MLAPLTAYGKEQAKSTPPPVYEGRCYTEIEQTVSTYTTPIDVGGSLTSGPSEKGSADLDINVTRTVEGGDAAYGYHDICNLKYDRTEGSTVGIGDSLDDDGTYLGPSVVSSSAALHFWGEADIASDLHVIGDLCVDGPLSIAGNLHVTGDLRTSGDVRISGDLTVSGTMFVGGEDIMFTCRGSANVKGMEIHGTAALSGAFVVSGRLGVTGGGRLDIGKNDSLTFVRNGNTRSVRMFVESGGAVNVHGSFDASALVSTQIVNKGNIKAHRLGGTVDIFYDVYVFVNGVDRSQGELARHGSELVIYPSTGGSIRSVDITVNDVLLDRSMYTYDSGSVTVFGEIMDSVSGDIEMFVTSDAGKDGMSRRSDDGNTVILSNEDQDMLKAALLPTMVLHILTNNGRGP
jgi:hypothetical protein